MNGSVKILQLIFKDIAFDFSLKMRFTKTYISYPDLLVAYYLIPIDGFRSSEFIAAASPLLAERHELKAPRSFFCKASVD
jgi:hypothetical protein